jgi:hypothetical protein
MVEAGGSGNVRENGMCRKSKLEHEAGVQGGWIGHCTEDDGEGKDIVGCAIAQRSVFKGK